MKLEEFRQYMHSKMKITSLDEKFQKAENEAAKERISLAIEQELSSLQKFDLQVIIFRKKEWKSQKVIGSEKFIQNNYHQWEISQNTG